MLAPACAQTTGDIEGVVTDPSGAGAYGALVRLTETTTGAARKLITGADGYYVAPGLSPGIYEIQVESAGFRSITRRGVDLAAGRSLRIDFALQLGEQSQAIEVQAAAPLVSSNAGDWGSAVGQQRLEELPLNGRDLFQLAEVESGASLSTSTQRTMYYGEALHMSINGARPSQNSYRIDGIYANDASGSAPSSALGQTLGVEAVQELRLVSSPFLSEYGRAAGGMFVAVSKSGSNEFHGSLFEFLRNSAMDAKNFFDPANGPAPPLKRNQFGGLLGGPIKHNRLFFLANYEGVRLVSSQTSISTTIGAAARAGNLPTGHVTIPASVAPFLNLYPLPNGLLFSDGTGQYITGLTTNAHEDYLTGKADYLYSERLHFNTRYTFDRSASTTPDPFLLWNLPSNSQDHFAAAGVQFVQSPSTLHDFHAGFSRVDNLYSLTQTSRIPDELTLDPGRPMGVIIVTGLTSIGSQAIRSLPFQYLTNDYQLNWDVTHIKGRHSIKAGGGFDRVQFNQSFPEDERGYYQFTSLVNLLAGLPTTASLLEPTYPIGRAWRQSLFFAFIQDEFRISRRLQISGGVRYEPYTVPTEVHGLVSALPNPLVDPSVITGIGLFRNPSKGNFAPRLALAWDLFGNGQTVFRAGAGIFYDPLSTKNVAYGGSELPPFYNRFQATNPTFPDVAAAVRASGPLLFDGMQYGARQPYAVQAQAAIEHQLGRSTVLRVGYAGNRGVHLVGYVADVNVPQPSTLPNGQLYFSPTAPLLNPNFQRIGMRLTQFRSSSNALQLHAARRLTAGFRFQANYSFAKVIDESSNPAFNDFLNDDYMPFPLNFRENRGLASFDLRHVFTADWSWQTRRFLHGWEVHGIFQAQSGTPFNPVIGFDRAGLRDNVSGDVGQRPILVPGVPVILGNPARWFNPAAFALPAAGTYGNLGRNTLAGPGLIDTDLAVHKTLWARERRQISLRVEAFNIANHPNFQIPSSLALFASNGSRVASAGQITQTTTTSRQLQLALRATF
jgi:hypothetical protein